MILMLKMRRDIMKVAVVTMHVKQGKCEENVSYMKQMKIGRAHV